MMERLTIAVLTFRRPDDLGLLIPLLVEQGGANTTADLAVRVLVVDNDPEGGAEDQVRSFALGASITVDYVNERTPGISAARNRALAESASDRLLVFIDDDERPSATWLTLLLDTWRQRGAVAVVGPVVSEFEIEPEPWIVAGGYFVRRRLTTGTKLDVAGTNNLLLDLEFVRSHNLVFDPAFGLSGGEDTLFTRQIARAGGLMIWCDEAVVLDIVPAARISRRWVTQRALSSGNAWSLTSVTLARSWSQRASTRLSMTVRGAIRIAGGGASVSAGVILRRIDLRARGTRTVLRGVGMVGGAWGYKYMEYGRPNRAKRAPSPSGGPD
jgi:succinoglycan biosynthesis protein ExoM